MSTVIRTFIIIRFIPIRTCYYFIQFLSFKGSSHNTNLTLNIFISVRIKSTISKRCYIPCETFHITMTLIQVIKFRSRPKESVRVSRICFSHQTRLRRKVRTLKPDCITNTSFRANITRTVTGKLSFPNTFILTGCIIFIRTHINKYIPIISRKIVTLTHYQLSEMTGTFKVRFRFRRFRLVITIMLTCPEQIDTRQNSPCGRL